MKYTKEQYEQDKRTVKRVDASILTYGLAMGCGGAAVTALSLGFGNPTRTGVISASIAFAFLFIVFWVAAAWMQKELHNDTLYQKATERLAQHRAEQLEKEWAE